MKSFYGGVLSIILKLTVFSFFVASIVQIFTREHAETVTRKIVNDIRDDQTRHFIGQNGFAIGISYVDYIHSPSIIHNYLADETYFDVRFFEVKRFRNPNKTYSAEIRTFEMGN